MFKTIIKLFSCLIPFKSLRKKFRNKSLSLLTKYINKGIIFPPQGLGDILYILLSLENKYDKKYTFLLTKKHFKDLCLLFPNVVKEALVLNEISWSEDYLYQHNEIYKKQKANSFLELFKNATSTEIKRDYSFNFDVNYKNDFVKEGFLLNKTVLILPECVSCLNEATKEYWIKYADILKEQGYMPVFNSKEEYGSYKSIFLNLSETINFAECAGNIIGYRSGLCDVLSYFTNAKGIYFYPNEPHFSNKDYIEDFENNPAQKYMEFCSLKKINPNKNIQEFIFDETKFPQIKAEVENE